MKKIKLAMISSAVLLLTAFGSKGVLAAAFNDISRLSAEAQASINWLAEQGITTGYSASTYGPADNVTRAQMVTFLYRLSDQPTVDKIVDFNDTKNLPTEFRQAITWAKNSGVTTGYSSKQFAPNDLVTREQMAAFFNRLAGNPAPTRASSFLDVSKTNSFYNAIAWLAETGVTTGYNATTYGPKNLVTREQMALFIKRYYDYQNGGRPNIPKNPVSFYSLESFREFDIDNYNYVNDDTWTDNEDIPRSGWYFRNYNKSGNGAEFILDQKYTTMSGTISLSRDYKNTKNEVVLNFYKDNVLCYTSPTITGGVRPVTFSIDVSNATQFRYEVVLTKRISGYIGGGIDAELQPK